ncbi:MAG: hypothetical protein OER21_13150, partial [Gemmatimonadota bacterium]|nr:hypothetical protein [Gemmatimonadota bacterium]
MDKQLGMAEFFAMESGEYLERLDALVSAPGMPNGEEFQRLTRALRGAALMANQQAIAGAAGAFEHVARAVREGRRPWDEATRQLAIRTVDDLKRLVRRVREWDDSDAERAAALAGELEQVGGRTTPSPRLSSPEATDAGTRAFLAREGAALAAALARAAGALNRHPGQREAAQPVLQIMQPLRGLASLSQFPPLPDLLEGIERAATLLAHAPQPTTTGPAVLDAAARALTQTTRDITAGNRADPDSVELRRFTDALRTLLGLEPPDVAIETLYFDDEGPHVVERAERRASGAPLGTVELTALGEHFRQIGDAVQEATTDTQRELRAIGLADTLRSLERGADVEWQPTALAFARAGRDAIARGVAERDPTRFADLVRDAGKALATGATRSLEGIARRLADLTGPLEAAVAPPAPE